MYELIPIKESNDEIKRYYIKHEGRLLMNDVHHRFQLELNEAKHMIKFRVSTISAHDSYKIMALIRKHFGYSYTIKCI